MGSQKCCTPKYCKETAHRQESTVCHFFDKGPVMQLPVPKSRTITEAFYKNVVLKKLKAHFKRLTYLRLLHDHAPTHKARIVTEFLESKKVLCSPTLPFFT